MLRKAPTGPSSRSSRSPGFDQLDLVVLADALHRRDVATVGDEGIDLAKMADAHRSGALELGRVRYQDHMPSIGDDGLRDLDLAEIEIEQRAVMVDCRGSDD